MGLKESVTEVDKHIDHIVNTMMETLGNGIDSDTIMACWVEELENYPGMTKSSLAVILVRALYRLGQVKGK